jgi:DMSO/TMAO reductase YedYZ molybdopterin-dependent catalytic subunit
MVMKRSQQRNGVVGVTTVLVALGLLTCFEAQGIAQEATPADPGTLAITGAIEHPLNLKISDLEKMPHVSVEVKDHDGKLTIYEGVALAEVLKAAGAPMGEKLRGANMASYVLAEAKDGYRVVFALPELDSAFTDSKVLIAYAANGKPLPDGQGPLRIVAQQEKRPARWVRMLLRIQVVKIQ